MAGPLRGVRGLALQWAMLIGYARVSTDNQETAAQVAALKSAGCERIYREKASGGRWDRPALQEILAQVRKGDCAGRLENRSVVTVPSGLALNHGAAWRG